MKKFDFSYTGGFPFDEDVLDYMQTSYKELFDAYAKMGLEDAPAANTPILITGGQFNAAGNTISNGWVWYNGEIIPLTGGAFAIANIGQLRVTITSTPTLFTYNDTNTHNAKFITTAAIDDTLSAYSTYDATHFPFQGLRPLGMPRYHSSLTVTNMGLGQANGTIWYRINKLTHELSLYGTLTLTTPGSLASLPSFVTMATITIPAMYDLTSAPLMFTAMIDPTSGTYPLFQSTGGSYMNSISALIDSSGNIKFEFIKAGGSTGLGIADYIVSFNAKINLKLK